MRFTSKGKFVNQPRNIQQRPTTQPTRQNIIKSNQPSKKKQREIEIESERKKYGLLIDDRNPLMKIENTTENIKLDVKEKKGKTTKIKGKKKVKEIIPQEIKIIYKNKDGNILTKNNSSQTDISNKPQFMFHCDNLDDTKIKKITIFSINKYLLIANNFKNKFDNKIDINVIETNSLNVSQLSTSKENGHYIFFFGLHYYLKVVPKFYFSKYLIQNKYFVYQTKAIWRIVDFVNYVDKYYYEVLSNAYKIYEFCDLNNYLYKDFEKSKYEIIKPFVYNNYINELEKKETDILFYGHLNERRVKIINKIKSEFKDKFIIKIIKPNDNIYGEALIPYIQQSKVVLNIHTRIDDNLETVRLNEVISHSNALIISEKPIDKEDIFIYETRANIIFVDQILDDLTNIDIFMNIIENSLESYEDDEKERNVQSDDLFFQKILTTDFVSETSKTLITKKYTEYVNPKLKQKISIIIIHENNKNNIELVLKKIHQLYSNETYNYEIILSSNTKISDKNLMNYLKLKLVVSENASMKELLTNAKDKISYDSDIVILQRSDVYQCSDILLYSMLNLIDDTYYSFPIYKLTTDKEKIGLQYMFNNNNTKYYSEFIVNNDIGKREITDNWIHHRKYKNNSNSHIYALNKSEFMKLDIEKYTDDQFFDEKMLNEKNSNIERIIVDSNKYFCLSVTV